MIALCDSSVIYVPLIISAMIPSTVFSSLTPSAGASLKLNVTSASAGGYVVFTGSSVFVAVKDM